MLKVNGVAASVICVMLQVGSLNVASAQLGLRRTDADA